MVGRAAVGLLGCLKKEQMSENALLQAAEAAKKCYLRPAADTDGWQALQPFGQTEVLVSVIVPVHNGEKDLKQCLNSILAQECGRNRWKCSEGTQCRDFAGKRRISSVCGL